MANNELRRVESYQFPAAHLSHLSDSQQNALDRFKEVCQDKGYYYPPGSNGHAYASHDDETLLYVFQDRNPLRCLTLTSKSSFISVYLLIVF